MDLAVIGISHRTAPVEFRETVALPGDLGRRLLRRLHADPFFEESFVLDTCNRTEVYFVCRQPAKAMPSLLDHLASLKGLPRRPDAVAFYEKTNRHAVEHLLRVAGGLDSQVVGEHQILGQLRAAYHQALEERTSRFLLNKLLHCALRTGKRVHTETQLGQGSASVAQAAVDLARQVFDNLAGKTALLIGAGQTAEQVARALVRRGVSRILVANRSRYRAEKLAADLADSLGKATAKELAGEDEPLSLDGRGWPEGPGEGEPLSPRERVPCVAPGEAGRVRAPSQGPDAKSSEPYPLPEGEGYARPSTEAYELADLPEIVNQADLIICSTGATEPVLTYEAVAGRFKRGNRLLLIVDIAVPRDVDARLGELPNVFLYNMNDLDRVVQQTIQRRSHEIGRAEAVVRFETEQFCRWYDSLDLAATIRLLDHRCAAVRKAEIDRYARRFHDRAELEKFADSLTGKIMHQPIALLRQLAEDAPTSDRLAAVDFIRRMFRLDEL